MSQQDPDVSEFSAEGGQASVHNPDDYGSLTIEDEPGTVDPAELAGTANSDDQQVGYEPQFSESEETSPAGDSEDAGR